MNNDAWTGRVQGAGATADSKTVPSSDSAFRFGVVGRSHPYGVSRSFRTVSRTTKRTFDGVDTVGTRLFVYRRIKNPVGKPNRFKLGGRLSDMSARNWRLFALGVAGSLLVFGVLFLFVDSKRVFGTISSADPRDVAATFGFGLCWLVSWSLVLRTVLATLEVDVPIGKSFLVYAAAVFANNVTPFGQAGGEPVAALLISKLSETRYETGLVGIATVDVLNVISSLGLVILGIGYYATSDSLTEELHTAIGTVALLVAGIAITFTLVWRYRNRIIDRVASTVAATVGRLQWSRLRSVVPTEEEVADRMRRFFDNVAVVATDPRGLAVALGFSSLGWLLQAVALFAAFAALGYEIPVHVAVFAIPIGNLAGATPLPGGLGSIEAAFVALLVPITGFEAAIVTAAVLLYRFVIYGMPVVIGGGSATVFGVRVLA